jgi:hypothetical protein
VALFEDFGVAENDEGVWKHFTMDPETKLPVELRLRAIPFEVTVRLERKHGHEETVSDARGFKRSQRVRTDEETIAWMWDRAEWAWTDARNFEIRLRDADSAEFYNRHLKPVTPYKAGDVVTLLKESLITAVKRRLFAKNLALSRYINETVEEMREKAEQQEGALLKTS